MLAVIQINPSYMVGTHMIGTHMIDVRGTWWSGKGALGLKRLKGLNFKMVLISTFLKV